MNEPSQPLDLSDRDLRGSRLANVWLAETAFANANLSGSTFDDVNASSVTFSNADLHDARFTNVRLAKTAFADVDLSGSTFDDVNASSVTSATPTCTTRASRTSTSAPSRSRIRACPACESKAYSSAN